MLERRDEARTTAEPVTPLTGLLTERNIVRERSIPFRARPGDPVQRPPRTYRLASSIRLPWLLGLTSLLVVALATAILVGRTRQHDPLVPNAVLDTQEAVANTTAQTVRRSLNEASADLASFAAVYDASDARKRRLQPALSTFAGIHGRYSTLEVVAGKHELAHAGPAFPPRLLHPSASAVPAVRIVGGPHVRVVQEYVAFRRAGWILLAQVSSKFLSFPLDAALPADAWLVDRTGRVLAGLEPVVGAPMLPSSALRQGGARARRGTSGAFLTGGSIYRQQVIAFAPVVGVGPAGALGLGLVTARTVSSFSVPRIDIRRQAILAGIVAGLVALLVFGWLYLVVVGPTLRLQQEAERIAYGDLKAPVEVRRYDEIGLTARALERIRIVLIRGRVKRPEGD